MHSLEFLQDLAVVLMVAGVVTLLFHRFKQPVVLGYILAGFIIGPHTPTFSLITSAGGSSEARCVVSIITNFYFIESSGR